MTTCREAGRCLRSGTTGAGPGFTVFSAFRDTCVPRLIFHSPRAERYAATASSRLAGAQAAPIGPSRCWCGLGLSHCATTGRNGLTVSDRGAAWPLARDPASSTLEILASEARAATTSPGKLTGLADSKSTVRNRVAARGWSRARRRSASDPVSVRGRRSESAAAGRPGHGGVRRVVLQRRPDPLKQFVILKERAGVKRGFGLRFCGRSGFCRA